MKKILVPVDFSETSVNATEFAVALAEKQEASIILFHSVSYSIFFYTLSNTTVWGNWIDYSKLLQTLAQTLVVIVVYYTLWQAY